MLFRSPGKKKDAEDPVHLKTIRKRPETEEEKVISNALNNAEYEDDYEMKELEVDEDGVALFDKKDDIELDAMLFGLDADDGDDGKDDGIFLEHRSKFEEIDLDSDLNREQRREAARRLKRKKLPSKGFG